MLSRNFKREQFVHQCEELLCSSGNIIHVPENFLIWVLMPISGLRSRGGGGEFFLTVIFPTFYISFLLCARPPLLPPPFFQGRFRRILTFRIKKTVQYAKLWLKFWSTYSCLIIDDTFLYDNLVTRHFYCWYGTNTYTLYCRWI